jgi:hypothetical protein
MIASLRFKPGRWHCAGGATLLLTLVLAPTARAVDWQVEFVDDNQLMYIADAVSIAVGSDGTPHIASSLRWPGVTTYATKVNGVWQVEEADGFFSGTGVCIALDQQGVPCMAYRKGNPDAGERVVLMFARRSAVGWKYELLDDVVQDSKIALCFATDGTPHIAYGGNGLCPLKHAYRGGAGWILETADATANSYKDISMALDEAGHPHICHAYGVYFLDPGRQEHAVWTGTGWENQVVDTAVDGCNILGSGIAVDAEGNTHMAWETHTCEEPGALRYGKLTDGSWIVETIDSGFTDFTAACSLAVDRLGRPHVVYGTYGMIGGGDSELRYAHLDENGNWVHEVIDADGDCGELNAVTIDAFGFLHVAYYAGDGSTQWGVIRYARSATPVAPAAGDLNCDGAINGYDIDPFVLALTSPDAYAAAFPTCDYLLADINGDGAVNGYDIDPFVALLTGK